MREISVNLAERSYVITIGVGTLHSLGAIVASCRMPTRVALISNPTVAKFYAESALASLKSSGIEATLITVPAGERFKTLATVRKIYDAMFEMKMDRGGAVVALGGGVIGDMAGFAAATYMRGIDLYQVPTTLLAQVDASVGGKTGVDVPRGKNLVGAFHQPRAVVIDTITLDTLPVRELRSGLAEIVKHGIIYDQEYFDFLDQYVRALLSRHTELLEEAIFRSVEIKRDIVQVDERENGLRAILNYGHTVGHAIEMLSGYGKYRHGEALAIGMVTEALLAEANGIAVSGTVEAVVNTLKKFKLPVQMDASLSSSDIVRAIELDKKTVGGNLRLALPVRIGECRVCGDISREALTNAIDAHRRLWLD
ncbi:MAG: 3-dehydroquinate synthase [Armatimonadetes bacterium]|nr:3-dehydroquinate synthase [Armatimonadota bacterium]